MPRTSGRSDLPRTIQRSDQHAQRIYQETHDSAVKTYGEGARAHRTAFASLKHSYKKQGDHWVPKDQKGPSDPQAARGPRTPEKSTDRPAKTGGGKEVPLEQWGKDDLYNRAQQLDISGRSKMSKEQLLGAIKKS